MFADRDDAGRQLAQRLDHLRDRDPVVLGLPRGGVPVAAAVAEALDAPLDVLVVRKLGAPHQPELAIGAVTNGRQPQRVVNEDVVRMLGISDEYLETAVQREVDEVKRRQSLYRSGRDPVDVTGRTTIVVDDGIATGATVRAGLKALRAQQPLALVLAVPVGPDATIEQMREDADEVICLETPRDFYAVGQHYRQFTQTTDEQVIRLLDEAAGRLPEQGGAS